MLSSLIFIPHTYAKSNNFLFEISIHLPAAISNIANESEIALTQQNISGGHALDLFTEERTVMGQKLMFKTSILR